MRMRLLLLPVALLFPVLLQASGYALSEMSAAAHGQAHAEACRVDDASAVWYNPAALTRIDSTDFYASSTWISTSGDFTGAAGNTTQMIEGDFLPSNVYIAQPVTDRLVFGAGFYQPFGLVTEWPADASISFVSRKADLRTYFLTPSFAYKFGENVSIGGGLDIVYATLDLDRNVMPPRVPLSFLNHIETDNTAFGFNLGVLVETYSNLNFAATYKHSIDLDFEGTTTFSGVPSQIRPLFPDGNIRVTIPLPSQFTLGVSSSYDNWSYELDVTWTRWEAVDALVLDVENNTPALLDEIILRNYANTYAVRIGVEYQWNEQVAFRGGYFYDQTPVPDRAVDPILPDGSRSGVTLGLGYSGERWRFDVAYMFAFFDERTSPLNNYVRPPGNLVAAGTYSQDASLLAFGFGYRF